MTIEGLKENISDHIMDTFPGWMAAEEVGLISMDDIINQIIFESIKLAYEDKINGERKSIRQFLIEHNMDTDSYRRSFSREMLYVQYYRDQEQMTKLKENGIYHEELEGRDMKDINKRMEGHMITPMNFLEIKNLHDLRILKKITGRQFQDTKKISNALFQEMFDEYDALIDEYKSSMIDAESTVFYTLALFTLEWKYELDWSYHVAEIFEGCKEYSDYLNRAMLFCTEINVPEVPGVLPGAKGSNRMYMIRQNYIPIITKASKEEWEYKSAAYGCAYSIFTYIKKDDDYKISRLLRRVPIEEWADFIKTNYWLWDNVTSNKKWTNEKIKIVRNFQKNIFRAVPAPSIK